MPRVVTKIGPADHGRRMALEEFDRVEGQEGYVYELSRGVITVSDVPSPEHLAVVQAVRMQLTTYWIEHPDAIHTLASGGECKILLFELQSERHPDLSAYRTPPPGGKDVWAHWVPELVVEVVSAGSNRRDYFEKPEEYLDFGVKEYWIIDPRKGRMSTFRRRGGRWHERIITPPKKYQTPLFPGFVLDVERVLKAGQ